MAAQDSSVKDSAFATSAGVVAGLLVAALTGFFLLFGWSFFAWGLGLSRPDDPGWKSFLIFWGPPAVASAAIWAGVAVMVRELLLTRYGAGDAPRRSAWEKAVLCLLLACLGGLVLKVLHPATWRSAQRTAPPPAVERACRHYWNGREHGTQTNTDAVSCRDSCEAFYRDWRGGGKPPLACTFEGVLVFRAPNAPLPPQTPPSR